MPPAEQLFAENLQLKQENSALKAQIDWLKKQVFGGAKSEKLDRAQMLLHLEALEAQCARIEAKTQAISYERSAKAAAARPVPAEAFAHLPVQETIVVEPTEVKADPEAYEQIGEESTFEVDIIPPKLFRRRIVRPKYRRRDDRASAPIVAPAPARPVQGGYASAGLIAWVLLGKYCDHLPLYAVLGIKGTMPERGLCRVA